MATPSSKPQLILRIIDGPHKGTRAPVREGFTLGRRDGDLVLNDAKMSLEHARITFRDGEWILVDLGSSNKIKVDDERYGEVVLYAGLEFVVGSTRFAVLEKPQAEKVLKDETDEVAPTEEVPPEALTWREILSALLSKTQSMKAPTPVAIRPFPHTVRLEFTSGVQHGTVWNLGYGPREVGATSFDLPLFDDAAADSCFLIDTSEGKVQFRASANAIVRLNGQVATLEPTELRAGDRIEIGKTRIRVSMV